MMNDKDSKAAAVTSNTIEEDEGFTYTGVQYLDYIVLILREIKKTWTL
jgi:hypothetical protein